MAINQVNDTTKFLEWKDITNLIIDKLGDNLLLTTADKTSLVDAINEVDSNTDINITAISDILTDIGIIANLTTLDGTDLVLAINSLKGEVDTNTTSIGTLGSLTTTEQTDLVGAINEVDLDLLINSEYTNQDNPRFATDTTLAVTTFDTGNLFNIHNSSAMAEGDQFFNDNSNNGGAGSAMIGDAITLTTSLGNSGRTDLRYGYEFYINEITSGAGTTDPIVENATTYYPITQNNDLYLGNIGKTISWSGWVYNADGSNTILIGTDDTTIKTYIDGVEQVTPYELPETDGWVLVKQYITLTTENKNLFPAISAQTAVSSVIKIALSNLYRADVTLTPLGVNF